MLSSFVRMVGQQLLPDTLLGMCFLNVFTVGSLDPEVSLRFCLAAPNGSGLHEVAEDLCAETGYGELSGSLKIVKLSKISRRMRQSVSPGLWWSRFKTKSHPYLWSVEDCRDWRRHKRLFQKGRYSLKSKGSPQIRLFCPSFWGSMILRESYGTMENANMLRSWKNLFHRRYVAALDLLATQGLELSRFCADNHSCCGSIFVSPRYHALCTTTPLMLLTSLASHCLPWNQQHSWNWYKEVSNMCFISLKLSTTSSWH